MKHIGVDIGGTFTDLVLWDDETDAISVHKLPSTPDDPARAAIAGIVEICDSAGVAPSEIAHVLHGTTVATNILLERSGAKVGLVTTEGFRDLLHIGRKKRPLNFSTLPGRAVANPPHRPAPAPADRARAGGAAARRGGGRAGRGGRPRRRRAAGRSRGRGGRGVLPVLLPQPRARAARARSDARDAARRLHIDEPRSGTAPPRVRALRDHQLERLYRPQGGALHRPLPSGADGPCSQRRAPSDDLGRRRHHRCGGPREAGVAAAVGAGSGLAQRGSRPGGRSARPASSPSMSAAPPPTSASRRRGNCARSTSSTAASPATRP